MKDEDEFYGFGAEEDEVDEEGVDLGEFDEEEERDF